MEIEDFKNAYYKTRKNKRRSKDSVEFEMHFERNILRLMNDLENHTYTPSSYTFIVKKPQPREIFACEMSLRIIDHYIEDRLHDALEHRFSNRTFNNRLGYGGVKAVNNVISDIYDVSRGFTRDAWIIKMDLRGYFPNADRQQAYDMLSEVLEEDYTGNDKDLLRYMLMVSIFADPVKDCKRLTRREEWEDYPKEKSLFTKPDGVGGAIGRLIWQVAMNYYINDIDHYIVDDCGLHYSRFVDDMVIITNNKEATLAMIPKIRKMLADKGCTLHPKKFYCQHYTKGVEFIGSTIKMDRVYANNRTIRSMMQRVRYFNHLSANEKNINKFIASMNSYLGIMKGRNAYNIIKKMIDTISGDWWKICTFNKERLCIEANEGYRSNELIIKKYNLKVKKK